MIVVDEGGASTETDGMGLLYAGIVFSGRI